MNTTSSENVPQRQATRRVLPRFILTVLAILALSLTGIVTGQETTSTREQRVDALFAEQTRGVAPGVAVAVVRDGKVLLSKGYGLASLEHRVPITSSTVFDVASVSKQFTGLAIAMLLHQGRIKLSDDIRTYIPELGGINEKITIDHLVHHTSGIRDWPGTLSLAGWRYDDVISFDQILTMAYNQRTLNFPSGSEYSYSNTGYNLLAELVARVTGKTFRVWTDENIFKPLGMVNSHFRDDHTVVVPNRAFGYRKTPTSFLAISNNLTAVGSSSLFSTVDDLAKWVMNFDDAKVGGQAVMEMTRTRGVLNNGSSIPYAFGISHGEYRGLKNLSHSGSWASFVTFVMHFPQQRFGVVVLCNSPSINPGRAVSDITDIFLEKELSPVTPRATEPAGPVVEVAPTVLDRYVGLYRLGTGWYVRIRRDGTTLKTQATREAEFPMTSRSESSFWVDGYNAPMTFENAEDGKVRLSYRGRRFPRLDEGPALTPGDLALFTGDYESDELQALYRVEVKDGSLLLRHRRHPPIRLTRLWKDEFSGPTSFTRAIEFNRDTAGKITGFAVLVDDRSRNVVFVRRR